MTEVIAVRRLSWEGAPNREVCVSIGKPAESPGVTGEFYCPIQTTGLGNDEFVTAIFGIDGLQAIELALRFIGYRSADINSRNVAAYAGLMGRYQKSGSSKKDSCAVASPLHP